MFSDERKTANDPRNSSDKQNEDKLSPKHKKHSESPVKYVDYDELTFSDTVSDVTFQIPVRDAKVKTVNVSSSDEDDKNMTPLQASRHTKKGGRADVADYKNPYLEDTCRKVLDHLSGTSKIPQDKHGKIIVGKLEVSRQHFEDNFKTNKLDLVKATKNLTVMAWTDQERTLRSLTGKHNNKHHEEKIKASPKKVLSILGSVKAHMLHCGDKDGPSMVASLKTCEKDIGIKFACDAQSAKRQQKSK